MPRLRAVADAASVGVAMPTLAASATARKLPKNVELAYDGLSFAF